MGNPPTSTEVAEPHSDSGGGSFSHDDSDPAVVHLAAGSSQATSAQENATQGSKGAGSISSRLENMEIGGTTDDDLSIDSDSEEGLLNPEADAGQGKSIKRKSLTAFQKAKKVYRNAQTFLKKMSLKKKEDLTERERNLIKLNERKISKFEADQQSKKMEVIPEEGEKPSSKSVRRLQRSDAIVESPKSADPKKPKSEKIPVKRGRSGEGEGNVAKRAKPSTSFDSPDECQVAVIDRADLDGKMTPERWMAVESRILMAIAEKEGGSDEEVIFDGAGWQKGVKVVGCSNRLSRDFLTQVIRNCNDIWPGARLEVIPRSQLPLRKTISLWIPPPVPEKDETTMKILARQNKNLWTQDWRVVSSVASPNGKGRDIVIAIDEASLDRLRKSEGSIKFGLGALKARLPNDKNGTKSTRAAGGSD